MRLLGGRMSRRARAFGLKPSVGGLGGERRMGRGGGDTEGGMWELGGVRGLSRARDRHGGLGGEGVGSSRRRV